jgi:sialate O-acetylesterase
MVLQRGQSDAIWGWASPGAQVTVSCAGKKATTSVAADGKWIAKLPPLPVGGPYTLTVNGPQTVTLNNVEVGDVWICSGQSNMQFGIGNGNNAKDEIAAANYPKIRLFMAPSVIGTSPNDTLPVDADKDGFWQVCSPTSVATSGWNGFTAVGYFFGRDLFQKENVPIGLIESNWGGTPAEAWTSEEALKKMPDFTDRLAALDASRDGTSTYESRVASWYAKNDPGQAGGWSSASLDDSGWGSETLPGFFQQAGIAELAGINGIVWYRKTVTVPADAIGKDITLNIMVDDNDTTWINGTLIGATEGFNVQRTYKIPANVLKAGDNVIAIRVLDTGGSGGVWGDAANLKLAVAGGSDIPLAGAWKYKLGIDLLKATPLPISLANNPSAPTVLYNGMIKPLIPFGIKGAIWYQGEANAGNAEQYKTLLPTMIRDWRTRWGEGKFPFLIVQLANWAPGGDGWPRLQEAQFLTAKNDPNDGIVTAIDIGDTSNIHPTNKQEVGRRLALVAEKMVYGGTDECMGPTFKSMKVEGNAIRIAFDHLGGGLVAKDNAPLTAFTIAGADGKFVPATAAVDGDTVVVSSPDVAAPTAVRYAFEADPKCSLFSKDGLPAFPFRTDWQTGK